MSKNLFYGEDVRSAFKKGADKVGRPVRIAIGPRGGKIAMARAYGLPLIARDGKSIIDDITDKDQVVNIAVEIIKGIGREADHKAGNGRKSAMIIGHAMAIQGLKYATLDVDPNGIEKGIKIATDEVVAELKTMSKPVKGQKAILEVATIASNSKEIGKVIADTIEKVGENGVITVDESPVVGITVDIKSGYEFDRGYASWQMMNTPEGCEFKNVPVVLVDGRIGSVGQLVTFMKQFAKLGMTNLVILAEDYDKDVVSFLNMNKLNGGLNVLLVKSPGVGADRKELLRDIVTLVGGTIMSDDNGINFDNYFEEVKSIDPKTGQEKVTLVTNKLGGIARIISKKNVTTIIGGKGDNVLVGQRVAELAVSASMLSGYDKQKIDERIAKLVGGIAVINVGTETEGELKPLCDSIKDAIVSTKAAMAEGIVAGGGAALVHAAKKVRDSHKKLKNIDFASEAEIGFEIVLKACEAPLRQIVENCNADDPSIIVHQITKHDGVAGYDAISEMIEYDMFKAGIVDAVKVVAKGLQIASAAVGTLLTIKGAGEEVDDHEND